MAGRKSSRSLSFTYFHGPKDGLKDRLRLDLSRLYAYISLHAFHPTLTRAFFHSERNFETGVLRGPSLEVGDATGRSLCLLDLVQTSPVCQRSSDNAGRSGLLHKGMEQVVFSYLFTPSCTSILFKGVHHLKSYNGRLTLITLRWPAHPWFSEPH